jgi:hypothetical protein
MFMMQIRNVFIIHIYTRMHLQTLKALFLKLSMPLELAWLLDCILLGLSLLLTSITWSRFARPVGNVSSCTTCKTPVVCVTAEQILQLLPL